MPANKRIAGTINFGSGTRMARSRTTELSSFNENRNHSTG